MENPNSGEHFLNVFDEQLSKYSKDQLLVYASRCWKLFVAANFAGIDISRFNILLDWQSDVRNDCENLNEISLDILTVDGISPSPAVRRIDCLFAAVRAIDLPGFTLDGFEEQLLKFRIFFVWSLVLSAKSKQLKSQIDSLIIELDVLVQNEKLPLKLGIQYLLEKSYFKLEYLEHSESKSCMEQALDLAGVSFELGGALGRRTRFQIRSLPQLTLKIEIPAPEADHPSDSIGNRNDRSNNSLFRLPQNCANQDDTLLETICYDKQSDNTLEDNSNNNSKLTPEQSACLFAAEMIQRGTLAFRPEIDNETMVLFVDEVIKRTDCWALQTRAFTERSSLESQTTRQVERACSQLECIYHLLSFPPENSAVSSDDFEKLVDFRLEALLCSAPIPLWRVGKLYGKVLTSLGCISEALRVYEKLFMLDEVVECYRRLGQMEKSETLVRKLISEKHDPIYYCILGDITNNRAHYERAIEISDDHCSRAHSSLGYTMLRSKEYTEAMKHYKRSVEIQPFQVSSWFNLGFCAMKAGEDKEAIRAYHRCIEFEPQHFEAWNNLAASYINTGQKARAQKILIEAVKMSFDNQKVWENVMLVSIDIGDFAQALSAIERILELEKKKPIDELPLEIIASELLVQTVKKNSDTSVNQNMKNSLLGIFSRVNSRQTLTPKLLRLYAKLKRPDHLSIDETQWSAYINLLERAFQRQTNQNNNENDENKWAYLLESLNELVQEMKIFWRIRKLDPEKIKSQINLRVLPIISQVEKIFGNGIENSNSENLKDLFSKISSL